jgi:ABC-2 type transport system ATP-binding protein
MTRLERFRDRLTGRLSGGMKQKLGLACTLVRSPELLLLDEPTVGVDPLSRRELWQIILQLVDDEGLTVLLSTAYLDEAERSAHVIVLHKGKLLAQGSTDEISRIATGGVYLVEPSRGSTPRGPQTPLVNYPSVVDAVPEAGRVRLIAASPESKWLHQVATSIQPAKPRLEDGFMLLLHGLARKRQQSQWRSITHPTLMMALPRSKWSTWFALSVASQQSIS